jgi:NAD-dependent dihydropyrimidine dehydrogenase PreA subunit
MANATSKGTGDDHDREGGKDYTDKPDPIREGACIWYMACATVCPTNSNKVDEVNL